MNTELIAVPRYTGLAWMRLECGHQFLEWEWLDERAPPVLGWCRAHMWSYEVLEYRLYR